MRLFKWLGIVVLGVLAISLIAAWSVLTPHPPSDRSLQHLFTKERTRLERLVAMTNEDAQMTRISPVVLRSVEHIYWPRPEAEWGVTPQRWDEYKGQFAALESEQGLFHSPESGDLMVFVYTWNFTFFGTTLSFVHCGDRQPPQQRIAPCATREEAGASDGQGEVFRFRKVADGWYIYYVGKAIGAVAP